MFPAAQRGPSTSLFAAAPFLGPIVGSIVSGFVGQTVGWRWVEGVMVIFTGVLWLVCGLIIPEIITIGEAFKAALSRSWILLFREPIILLLSIDMAIISGTLYMLFGAVPVVYQQGHGWSPGIGGLVFPSVAVGMIPAVIYSVWDNKRYVRAVQTSPSGFAPSKARLPPSLLGSSAMPIGLFWFAWTNYPSFHWLASFAAGALLGSAWPPVFPSIMNHLIDAYPIFTTSVLAANAVLRSLFGATFPIFTTSMYADLGIHWESSLRTFLALACVPFPFLFYKYGPAIRSRCKYAAQAAAFLERLNGQADAQQRPDEDDSLTIDSKGAET